MLSRTCLGFAMGGGGGEGVRGRGYTWSEPRENRSFSLE